MILEYIHSVIGNLVWKYNIKEINIDKSDLWLGILAVALFTVISTINRLNGYTLGQLMFFRNIIILNKHMAEWRLIRQKIQMQTNQDNIPKL